MVQYKLSTVSIRRNELLPDSNYGIYVYDDEILMINHDSALCPVYLTPSLFDNVFMNEIITFVTSSSIESISKDDQPLAKDIKLHDSDVISECICRYKVFTNVFNRICLFTFTSIMSEEEIITLPT